MTNLNCLMDHILYQIFKIIFNIFKKKHGQNIDNPSVKINVNKIENRITFKVKNGCSLELLTPETVKSLGRIENKITKDKNGEKYHILKLQK